MALVTDLIKQVDIPHEKGEWMQLRRLSWRQLEAAAEIKTNRSMKNIKGMGGDIIGALQKLNEQEQKQTTAETESVEGKYDRGAVLISGIKAWSYEAEVTEVTVDELDEETAAWAFDEIMNLGKARTEEERKND